MHTYRQVHMAMPVEVTVWADTPQQAEAGARAAFAAFARVDDLMNDYVAQSEISRVSAAAGTGPQRIDDEMLAVLAGAERINELSGGAFDVTAGPVVALWRTAAKTGRMPDAQKLVAARKLVGADKLRLDEPAQTVELTTPGMKLDFGGIAKGYACDLATAALREHGLAVTFVAAGGDMRLGDAPPGTAGWLIDVPGHDPMTLKDTAVSISGDNRPLRHHRRHPLQPRRRPPHRPGRHQPADGRRARPARPRQRPARHRGCVMPPAEFRKLLNQLDGVTGSVFTAPDNP